MRRHVTRMRERVFGIPAGEDVWFDVLAGTVGTFSMKAAGTGIGFFIVLFLARLLGPAGYGAYAYGAAWVSLLSVPVCLGFPWLLVREVAVYQAKGEWGLLRGILRFASTTVFLVSLVTAGCAAILGGILSDAGRLTAMLSCFLIALPTVPLVALTRLRGAAMRGFRRVLLGQAPEMIIWPLLFLAALAGLSFFFPGRVSPPLVMGVNVTISFVTFCIGSYVLFRTMPPAVRSAVPRVEARKWLGSAVPFLFIGGFQLVNAHADVVMLGVLRTAADVGVYKAAARFAGIMTFMLMSVNRVLAPRIARLWAAGKRDVLQRLITRAARVLFVVSFCVWGGIVLFGRNVLELLGTPFVRGYGVLSLLSGAFLACTTAASVGLLLMMTGHEKKAFRLFGLSAVLNVAMNALLIPRYGINGAAYATAASMLVTNAGAVVVVARDLRINPTVFRFGKGTHGRGGER